MTNQLHEPDFDLTLSSLNKGIDALKEKHKIIQETASCVDEIRTSLKPKVPEIDFPRIEKTLFEVKTSISSVGETVNSILNEVEKVRSNTKEIREIYSVKKEIQNQILFPVNTRIVEESRSGARWTTIATFIGIIASLLFTTFYGWYSDNSSEIVAKMEAKYIEVSGKLEEMIKKNNLLTELLRLEVSAIGGSREDLDIIKKHLDNPNFPFSNEALIVYRNIKTHYSRIALNSEPYETVNWQAIGYSFDDVASMTFSEMKELYTNIRVKGGAQSIIASSICYYILFLNDNFTIEEKMRFCIKLIESDLSLLSVTYAQRYLMRTCNLREFSMNYDGWVQIGIDEFKKKFPDKEI